MTARDATHVILDLDGTLINTEQLVDEVVSAIVHDLADRDPKAVRDALERVRGMRPRDGSERLIDLLQLTDPKTSARASADALLALTEAKLNARWGEVALMPGASRLLRFLADAEIPVALATSTPAKYLAAKMASHAGALDGMRCVCTGDEVERGKPDPEIFRLAASRLGVDPARCVVIEDTPLGVRAAKAAGMHVVAVPSIAKRDDLYVDAGADVVISSLYDLDFAAFLPAGSDWIAHETLLDPVLPLPEIVRVGGAVVKGFGRGSKVLGIPTANLDATPLKLQSDALAPGIYFGHAALPGGRIYDMVMSIGWNPFFDNARKTIEPWLLHEFESDFYDVELRLTVVGYVRPEANFTTLECLIARIRRDGDVASAALRMEPFAAHRNDAFLTFEAGEGEGGGG
ncbi:uncharacterized protein MICPUCDRAFT_36086 [Micromonas pusilla CCMP1545]|uniref:riboflavin kinase n=1 Tax=Micromonas pusilla (strain CCMP1545) TaxID=564608 RepID=C1N4L5_MICPC|nr:uncharacterized protein MICPUCDRAFT_36086 [Micromonas pusilla CCMP1545]EEH52958.1 predicted protein [Micromonas pusilla CCMP1545]|eukprot:XP_003063019.1 predicted protein [Micromonas pusilla CCMP1545]